MRLLRLLNHLFGCLLLVLMLGCARNEEGLQSAGTGTLSGQVTDTAGNGVSGASMETVPATTTQTTDSAGNYSFGLIALQSYTVTAKKTGFVKGSSSATVEKDKTTTANFNLASSPSYAGAIQPIFSANCTAAGCHGSSPANNYSLASYAGATAKNVTSFDAEASVLMKRISGTSAGGQMPQGASPLSASDQQKIKDWLNAGIPNN